MSIESIKQEADLQEHLERISTQYKSHLEERISKLNQTVLEEFTDHMRDAGFSISTQGSKILAAYKTTKIELQLPLASERRNECVAAFPITCSNRSRKIIYAFEKAQNTNHDFLNEFISKTSPKNGPIATLEEKIAEINLKIASFDSQKIVFRIMDPEDRPYSSNLEGHGSFIDALKHYLE
jgi:hypothetical protein